MTEMPKATDGNLVLAQYTQDGEVMIRRNAKCQYAVFMNRTLQKSGLSAVQAYALAGFLGYKPWPPSLESSMGN